MYFGRKFRVVPNDLGRSELRTNSFYIGYSGWGDEQLESELERDMWFTKNSNYVDLTRINPDDLWGEELVKNKTGLQSI